MHLTVAAKQYFAIGLPGRKCKGRRGAHHPGDQYTISVRLRGLHMRATRRQRAHAALKRLDVQLTWRAVFMVDGLPTVCSSPVTSLGWCLVVRDAANMVYFALSDDPAELHRCAPAGSAAASRL